MRLGDSIIASSKIKMSKYIFSAICFSKALDRGIVLNGYGDYQVIEASSLTTDIYTCGITPNYSCAKYSDKAEVFCVTGSNGITTSSDGYTWNTIPEPSNLEQLRYDEYPECFSAYQASSKTYYISEDGETCEAIPVDTLYGVAYSKDHDIYCAIGTLTSKYSEGTYALFSKDRSNWIETLISKDTYEHHDVIYFPVCKKFVCTLRDSVYYYAFDPSGLAL